MEIVSFSAPPQSYPQITQIVHMENIRHKKAQNVIARIVQPKRATTAGRKARAGEIVPRSARPAWWPDVGAPLERGVRRPLCCDVRLLPGRWLPKFNLVAFRIHDPPELPVL